MAVILTPDPSSTLNGETLYSFDTHGGSRHTGVYIPPTASIVDGTPVNLLIYLHGYYVSGIKQLFNGDKAEVRKQVLAAGKNVILAAPWLGQGGDGDTWSLKGLQGSWGAQFITEVIGALANRLPPSAEELQRRRTDLFYVPSPRLRLGKLIIACHSGGGEAMRYLVDSLGQYKLLLRQCWGFDCLYGVHASPDDATFWYNWAPATGRELYVSYGSSTVPQSVKLSLMAGGLANPDGSRRDPGGAEVQQIHVSIGIPTGAKDADDLMELTKLENTATAGRKDPYGKTFVDVAASNLRKNAKWPGDLMAMHYNIAKQGLLERLKGATFL